MSDSSWGAPPAAGQAGYWGPTGGGPAQPVPGAGPAGPAYDAPEAQQTRPVSLVPDAPAYGGGDQDDDRGAARLSG
ncbi:phosphatidate cytidylyltransferase, partial [Streptomyces olivaceoviridis]